MIASTGFWYEVMLSPFNSSDEAWSNIEKYRYCYPIEEQTYRVTMSYIKK
jgi:hypothetical protein